MKRTTIVDVGRLAGVSTKTVSRVLNGGPNVSIDVQRRVRAAAEELDYHPNVFAQALVRRRSHMIGLVYENPSPSYVVELQRGVLERLTGERYRLVVIPVRSVQENAAEVVRLLRSAALDGVVLAPPASDNPVILRQLKEAGIFCARIAPTRMIDSAPSNLVDDVTAAREIAAYVIALGHCEIAIIRGDATHPSSEARMLGYTQAFHQAGIALKFDQIEPGLFTYESGLAAGRAILNRPNRPTAILAQNDDMAVGAMMAARELGMQIPEQLSVVGFDDSEVSRIIWPRLTTVRQPVFAMAVAATDMVIAQLEGRDPLGEVVHSHELMIRESAAPPPGLRGT